MQDDNRHRQEATDRTKLILWLFGGMVAAFIVGIILALLPWDGLWMRFVGVALSVVIVSVATYLMYFALTYWWRKWRKQAKPYATPGFKSVVGIVVVWGVVLPGVVLLAAAFENLRERSYVVESVRLSPPPTEEVNGVAPPVARATHTPIVLPTVAFLPSVRPQQDLWDYRSQALDERLGQEFNACWNAVGGFDGLHERIDDLDDLSVWPMGDGYRVSLHSGPSAEARKVLETYEYTMGLEEPYDKANGAVMYALKRGGLLEDMQDEEAERQQVFRILYLLPLTDAQWLEIRVPVYAQLVAYQAYYTSYINLMELVSPGCAGR